MKIYRVNNFEDYQSHSELMQEEYAVRKEYEKSLLPRLRKSLKVKGYSYPAGRCVKLHVDFEYGGNHGIPNWRERLVCPESGLNCRMRAAVQLFDVECAPYLRDRIYITEQVTALYRYFSPRYENITGSEFVGTEFPSGSINPDGIRHEDLTSLSFSDASFDHLLSFDCFEHIPNYHKAFGECFRVLAPGGNMLFSVPFNLASPQNVTRANMSHDGVIEHILEPEYHGDPMSKTGCLCFRHYGWEMFDGLRAAGFRDVYALLFWSREYGYLGGEQALFIARK